MRTVDDETMTEEEFDQRLNESYWQGKRDALADAIGAASVKAGHFFARRKDSESQQWRAFADWLVSLHKKADETYTNIKNGVTDTDCK